VGRVVLLLVGFSPVESALLLYEELDFLVLHLFDCILILFINVYN